MTTSNAPSLGPEQNPVDERAKRVRDRTMDLLADAAIHVQRIEDKAQKLGLSPELVDGVGDSLYEAVVTQLDLALKIVERSQTVVERLFALRLEKKQQRKLLRIDAVVGVANEVRQYVVVTNDAKCSVDVKTVFKSASLAGRTTLKEGKAKLAPRQETAVEIEINIADLEPSTVYTGTILVWLLDAAGCSRESVYDVELWLRKP
jgi:hypothetical protein